MTILFYLSSAIAVMATLLAITRRSAFHALLYLVVSLLALALVFFSLGAALVAILEVIIYAGAIMVLFVFVIMMLNLGKTSAEQEAKLLQGTGWIGPGIMASLLLIELVYVLTQNPVSISHNYSLGPKEVALSLFGPYLLAVELASFLLLAGLVGAYHLGVRSRNRGGDA